MKNFKLGLMCSVFAFGAVIATDANAAMKQISAMELKANPAKYGVNENKSNDLDLFLTYYDREPCQNYQPAPGNIIVKNCDIYAVYKDPKPVAEPVVFRETTTTVVKEQPKPKTLASYKIYFGLDKYNLDYDDEQRIDLIADEISDYDVREVTVEGYTDTSGNFQYNQNLSQKRAEVVSEALARSGVENRVIDKAAYGETRLAVETNDGVVEDDNRRVIVKFMK